MSESDQDPVSTDGGAPPGVEGPADYETATARLDEIIARLDSGDAQLRETLDLCAEAKTLIEYCAAELAAVDEGLKELRLDDLAASLKGGQDPGPAPDGAAAAPTPGSSSGRPPQTAEPVESPFGDEPPTPEEPPF
jgi:exodeoxyribonuclease VII small subunit